jgi:hypothetical protein
LTDEIPSLSSCKVAYAQGPWTGVDIANQFWMRCLARITLTFDPLTTPSELAETYRKIRGILFSRRFRPLSEKQMYLAVFWNNLDRDGRLAMLSWNQQYPHWAYTRYSNFKRDAQNATERLLQTPVLDGRTLGQSLTRSSGASH